MSRIGKKPILIPEDVEVKIEGQKVIIKGSRGELQREIRPEIKIEIKEGKILVSPKSETSRNIKDKKIKALFGLSRAILSWMVEGVIQGHEKKLEIEGLGYRASVEGEELVLKVGFSHLVRVKAPPFTKFSVDKNTITVSGIDKEVVTQTAAKIRKIQVPEPYKGKGIRYQGEKVRKKLGKKVITTTVGG